MATRPASRRPARKRSPDTGSSAKPGRVRDLAPIVIVIALALAVLAGLAVLPARTWLSQRQNMSDAQAELDRVNAEVAVLEAELELLETDAEIERLARENFDLVYPGEESYRIVPETED